MRPYRKAGSLAAAAALALLFASSSGLQAHDDHTHAQRVLPNGPAAQYAFPLAKPGSYRLPAIRAAADGSALKEDGETSNLRELLVGRITVFSFIYTRCADICPLATARIADFQDLVAKDPDLARKVRLVSMSFDPEHDTPTVMAEYASAWRRSHGEPEWLFLTTSGRQALEPILRSYDQAVDNRSKPEDPSGGLDHVLRAFLVDEAGMIRNIYSLDFLDPILVLNDVQTLLME